MNCTYSLIYISISICNTKKTNYVILNIRGLKKTKIRNSSIFGYNSRTKKVKQNLKIGHPVHRNSYESHQPYMRRFFLGINFNFDTNL